MVMIFGHVYEVIYFNHFMFTLVRILDRHPVWRSLDPTLDIWSNFMKIKEPFTSFFASF